MTPITARPYSIGAHVHKTCLATQPASPTRAHSAADEWRIETFPRDQPSISARRAASALRYLPYALLTDPEAPGHLYAGVSGGDVQAVPSRRNTHMASDIARFADPGSEPFIERHAWKVLLGVCLIIGIFGAGDMLGGASDLQKGETILMHSLTGMSWDELQAASPGAANLIDTKFRTDGASLATLALLSLTICLTGFRRGQRWAWYALWTPPLWMALTVLFVLSAVKHPSHGTPVPVISGSIFFVLWVTLLALSMRKFFRS